MKSKTIILSSQNSNGRAILTLYDEEDLLKSKIRLYNTSKLNRFCKLGIYHNKTVFSANLLEKDGVYLSSMVGDFNMDDDFYCAIINTEDNNNVILSGGTYSGFFFNEENVFESKLKAIEKENPNTNLYNYENDELIEESIKEVDQICNDDCEKCKNCKYKNWFYSQTQNTPETNNELIVDEKVLKPVENQVCEQNINQLNTYLNNIPNQKENTIETQINSDEITTSLSKQFQTVFNNYPEDSTLTQLIPNGKFVKINENNNNYSIGAIYENEKMKYICYAILCNYNSPTPQEIGEHYQWLPLDKEDPMSEGYYIVFQDANDLKIVEM